MKQKIKDDKNIFSKNSFYSSVLIFFTFIFYFMSYSVESLYQILSNYSCYFLGIIYIVLFLFFREKSEFDRKDYLYFCIVVMFVICGCLFNNFGLGSIFNIFNLFMFLFVSSKIKVINKTILSFKLLLPFLYILFIVSDHSFLNTNFVGYIYLIYYISFNNLYKLQEKKIYKFIINVFLLVITINAGNIYQCRTAQIMAIVYFFMQFVDRRIFTLNFLKKTLPYLLSIGSIIAAFIYVYLWKIDFSLDLSAFANKKLFSGRNLIWNECFEILLSHPIFGVGGNYILKSHFTYALHNSMMMILVTYGIPVFTLFLLCFKNYFNYIYDKFKKRTNFKYLIVTLICLFFVDYFESYIYWSVFNFIILFNVIVCLNNKNEVIVHEKK